MKTKRMKKPIEQVRLGGKIGILQTGVEGESSWEEVNIPELEVQLANTRKAKEQIPSIKVDDDLIINSRNAYSYLSEEAKKNLSFILTGMDERPKKKYSPGTSATWVRPYVEELIVTYKKTIEERDISLIDRIPFFKSFPIGAEIILSEIRGLQIRFTRKTKNISYMTSDQPMDEFVYEGDRHVCTYPFHMRSRNDDHPRILWQVFYAGDGKELFTVEAARRDALEFANDDMVSYNS
jgi:hypothetical protein